MKSRYRPSASSSAIRALHDLTGAKHILLTGRGAAGIVALLRVMNFRNRSVLIPANTCYIVLLAVLESGNRPVLVDVDAQTGNLNAQTLEAANVKNPAEVIPAHMYGLAAPMAEINRWARSAGAFVIEDAALASGAMIDGRPAGTTGNAGIFSFGQGKIIDMQAGGALLTDDDVLALEIRRVLENFPLWDNELISLANQWHSIYWALHQHEADNPRLTTLYPPLFDMYRAIITCRLSPDDWHDLPAAMDNLPANLAHRDSITAIYDALPQKCPVRTLPRPDGSVVWRYPLLVPVEHRRDLLEFLWSQSIHGATRWYPSLRYMASALVPDMPAPVTPNADRLGAEIINLPVDEDTDEAAALRIVGLIQAYFDQIQDGL